MTRETGDGRTLDEECEERECVRFELVNLGVEVGQEIEAVVESREDGT